MAVTESKGNGYALYNGVKLPNIDAVWTDKEKYPYAYITATALAPVGGTGNMYAVYLFDTSAVWDSEKSGLRFFKGTYLRALACVTEQSDADNLESVLGLSIPVNSWGVEEVDSPLDEEVTYLVSDMVWVNTDILTTDNTVYLAASDPIPLDGMNVIEWDGVTEGLEVFGGGYYRIADFSKASSGVAVSFLKGEYIYGVVSFFYDADSMGAEDAWGIGKDGNTEPVVYAIPESVSTELGISAGIYADNYVIDSAAAVWIGLLAYTPATTEPEEPEEPDTPTVEKFPLMQLIMGILSELNCTVKREPIAYLYNGVRLPKLPEWDRGVYPFAVIFGGGALWIMTELPYISSEGNTYALSAQYKIYTVQNGEYVLKSSSSGVQVGSAPIWSNSDLYNSNGTLYLEASDPVPVYE